MEKRVGGFIALGLAVVAVPLFLLSVPSLQKPFPPAPVSLSLQDGCFYSKGVGGGRIAVKVREVPCLAGQELADFKVGRPTDEVVARIQRLDEGFKRQRAAYEKGVAQYDAEAANPSDMVKSRLQNITALFN